jgi:two-component system response regulator HydG
VEKKKILVVDNEETTRDTLLKILEREGYLVLTANDGQAALEIIKEQRVNVVVSDVCMPKMDGNKLLKMAKTIRPEVEIILMTGHGKMEMGVEALKEGAFDFIQKPFTKLALQKTVKQALEKQALAAEMRFLKERVRELIAEISDLVEEQAVQRLEYPRTLGVNSTP